MAAQPRPRRRYRRRRNIVTRRPADRHAMSANPHRARTSPEHDGGLIVCGDLLLDLDAHQAFADGAPIHLSHRQFSVLRTLVSRAGLVVPTDELRDVAADGGPSTANTVRSAIAELRASLGRGRRRPRIEVARARGYVVVVPAE